MNLMLLNCTKQYLLDDFSTSSFIRLEMISPILATRKLPDMVSLRPILSNKNAPNRQDAISTTPTLNVCNVINRSVKLL